VAAANAIASDSPADAMGYERRSRPSGGIEMIQPTFDTSVLKLVASEVRNIKAEFHGVVSDENIDLVASESLQGLAGSKVPQFVPLFVGRFTRERLVQLTGRRPRSGLSLLTT
jgi:hypothetical protein